MTKLKLERVKTTNKGVTNDITYKFVASLNSKTVKAKQERLRRTEIGSKLRRTKKEKTSYETSSVARLVRSGFKATEINLTKVCERN